MIVFDYPLSFCAQLRLTFERMLAYKVMLIKYLMTFDGYLVIGLSIFDLKIVFHLHCSTNLQKRIKP